MRLPYLRSAETGLDAEPRRSRSSARAGSAGDLAQALEAVGDRVAVRGDRRRRGVHVGAVGQVSAEGAVADRAVVGVVGQRRARRCVAQAPTCPAQELGQAPEAASGADGVALERRLSAHAVERQAPTGRCAHRPRPRATARSIAACGQEPRAARRRGRRRTARRSARRPAATRSSRPRRRPGAASSVQPATPSGAGGAPTQDERAPGRPCSRRARATSDRSPTWRRARPAA